MNNCSIFTCIFDIFDIFISILALISALVFKLIAKYIKNKLQFIFKTYIKAKNLLKKL